MEHVVKYEVTGVGVRKARVRGEDGSMERARGEGGVDGGWSYWS